MYYLLIHVKVEIHSVMRYNSNNIDSLDTKILLTYHEHAFIQKKLND